MAERTIIGVDFSGAEDDNATWVTDATLTLPNGILTVQDCYRPGKQLRTKLTRDVAHQALERLLRELPPGAVAALDFPFSVPLRFAQELVENPATMPDVWRAAARMNYREFDERRRNFVDENGELMRRGDGHFGGPFSPLKAVNPDMLPMTFHGMRMLNGLWRTGKGFQIPPLPTVVHSAPTLLETMPGVLLRNFDLPARNYKTKNKGNNGHPENVRRQILMGLENIAVPALVINDNDRANCLRSADCLDSLVAAIGAAMWAMNQLNFVVPREAIPEREELDYARLEGWIYAPGN